MQTRRDFLKIAAMLSGAAGVGGFIPESVQRAYAIEPEAGSTYLDAEHIVILMQENRSFDHTLGTLQGVRGFNDPRAIRLANGNSVFVQTENLRERTPHQDQLAAIDAGQTVFDRFIVDDLQA
jgi:phospholipase C